MTSKDKSFYVIAEMAWAHDGSLDKCLKIIEGASEAGADAIGIHITHMPSYMVPNYGSGPGRVSAGKESDSVYNYLNRINLTTDDWLAVGKVADDLGIDLCVMPNDMPSLEFAITQLNANQFVISAASFLEYDLVQAIAMAASRIFLRTGGSTHNEIRKARSVCEAINQNVEIVLLHGVQNYPTEPMHIGLGSLRELSELHRLPVGIADHVDADDALLAKAVPCMALALGARFIEKHITLDRAERGEDFEAALGIDEFSHFVHLLKLADLTLGSCSYDTVDDGAIRYREVSRKKVVAAKSIKRGETICEQDICFKRSDEGETLDKMELIIGGKAGIDFSENDGIFLANILQD